MSLFIGVSSGKFVIIVFVDGCIGLGSGVDRSGFGILPSARRALAVAHTALYVGNLLVGQFLVAGDEVLPPEGEVLHQFTREIEVETDGPEGVCLAVDVDMAATAHGVGLGDRLRKADVEEGEEDVGAVADVIACTFPLEHGLMQDASGVKVGVEMVTIVDKTVVSLVLLCLSLNGIVQQVLVARTHIEGRGGVLDMIFNGLGCRDFYAVYAIRKLGLDAKYLDGSKVFLEILAIGVEEAYLLADKASDNEAGFDTRQPPGFDNESLVTGQIEKSFNFEPQLRGASPALAGGPTMNTWNITVNGIDELEEIVRWYQGRQVEERMK